MKRKTLILIGLIIVSFLTSQSAINRYVGGDISLLPLMEKSGSKYYDNNGNQISDLVTYCYDQGMNAMRVRLFVDPDSFLANLTNPESWQTDACQSFDYILPLCKRIREAGHKLLLDFHYSDTWADPSNQWTPADWATLSDSQLYQKIFDYTKEVLTQLKENGIVPEFIQTGNEISYGMCWGAYGSSSTKKAYTNSSNSNLTRFGNLLTNAIKACREVCPDSKIILHTERVANTSYLTSFYDWAKNFNLDYDIIGLSYYFYYHGNISTLDAALTSLDNKKYGKEIWIVETGCYLNWTMGDTDKQFYGTTEADQNQFAVDLLATLDNHSSVTGVFWWEMEFNAKGTNLSGWYNASLFDNNTGKATTALYTLADWASQETDIDDPKDEDENDKDIVSNFYLLYNDNGASNWTVPGTLMTDNNNGTFSIYNVNISKAGEEYGWFSITSVLTTDWDEININRYGPETNNENPTVMVNSKVVKEANSWQVPSGVYDIHFDTNNMLVTLKLSATIELIPEVATDLEGHSGSVVNNEIYISAPKTENRPYAYVYIPIPPEATSLYYKIVKDTNFSSKALDGFEVAEFKDNKYSIPLEIATSGKLYLYYTTAKLQSVPVVYEYRVIEIESGGMDEADDNDSIVPDDGNESVDDNDSNSGDDIGDNDETQDIPENDYGDGDYGDDNYGDNDDVFSDESGITNVQKENIFLDVWFDLNGNRISKPVFPGLYIFNGKKIIIKK